MDLKGLAKHVTSDGQAVSRSLQATAFHEAAHAVFGLFYGLKVDGVTVTKSYNVEVYSGLTEITVKPVMRYAVWYAIAMTFKAGPVLQKKMFPEEGTYGNERDYRTIEEALEKRFGNDQSLRAQASVLVDADLPSMFAILDKPIHAIAQALIERMKASSDPSVNLDAATVQSFYAVS